MASHGGTIRPVSPLTSHSLMCLHLEAVLLLEQQAAVLRERNRENAPVLRSRVVRPSHLLGILVVLFGLLCMCTYRLDAQSTFGSIRGVAQDNTGAAIPDAQLTRHSIDENTEQSGENG